MKNKNQQGIVTLIFVLLMSVLATLVLVVGQSRLLLAIQRGRSAADTLVASYQAETEINNLLSNLSRGFIKDDELPSLVGEKTINGVDLKTEIKIEGNNQIITVTARKLFSVNKIQAIRTVQNVLDGVEIALALDCTGSMDAKASSSTSETKTRFDAQEAAAINFVNKLIALDSDEKFKDKFSLGVLVFGIDAKWLSINGSDITPGTKTSFSDIKNAISQGFGATRAQSPACQGVMDATSVGSAFVKAHEYFDSNQKPKTKQIEVVITDGEPNTRIPNSKCTPNVFCPAFLSDPVTNTKYCEAGGNEYGWTCYNYQTYKDNDDAAYATCAPLGLEFLRCALANTNKSIGGGKKGIRNPNIDAYSVTIFANLPSNLAKVFRDNSTSYFNASQANQLTNQLDKILTDIVRKLTSATISRVIPVPDE